MNKKETDWNSIDFNDPDDYAPDLQFCPFCGSESDERVGYNEKLDLLKRSCSNCESIYIEDSQYEIVVLKGGERDWEKYLSQNLTFPFKARVEEISDEELFRFGDPGPIRYKDVLTVIGIRGYFNPYRIVVDVKKGGKKHAVVLSDLSVIDKRSLNYKIVNDYLSWDGSC